MAKWQFTQKEAPFNPTDDEHFDDGRQELPGDEGFTIEDVKSEAGPDRGWNYVGPSDPPPVEDQSGSE